MVAVCSKTSATSAGAVVEHVFEPAEQRFSQRHFRENVVEIVDETSVSVTGYVRYNFTDAPGSGGAWDSGCPHRDGAARCYCPLPHKAVTVKVEDDQGTVTDVAPNEAGYFAAGVTYGHRYKVYLQAFEGEDGSGPGDGPRGRRRRRRRRLRRRVRRRRRRRGRGRGRGAAGAGGVRRRRARRGALRRRGRVVRGADPRRARRRHLRRRVRRRRPGGARRG